MFMFEKTIQLKIKNSKALLKSGEMNFSFL